jgi:transposase-like protein
MKQHIYCRSGVSSTRRFNRIASRSSKRSQYSVQEKIRILRVVQTMVDEHRVTYAEAASAVTIDQSMISRWRKQEGAFGSVKRPDMLHLGSGPHSSLLDIEPDLLEFIETCRKKGLPVNRIALMRKAQMLLPQLERSSRLQR